MKTTLSLLFAAALSLSSMPAHAVKLDLSTMSCKQFLESGEDTIKMVLTWMDGWYKGDEDERDHRHRRVRRERQEVRHLLRKESERQHRHRG